MFRKRTAAFAVAAVAVGLFATLSPAQAAVQRYQFQTVTATVLVNGTYDHSYTVTVNPCDGTFAGTGQYPSTGTPVFTESITGSQVNGVINYTSAYTNAPPYTY